MEFKTHTLQNGIRLVHFETSSMIAYCGMLINAGSRDETEPENGLAHFIEHALFKGTAKRKPYHIISRLEDVGGDLNAYTTKEETCIHATFLHYDYSRAIELISDIIFSSIFPAKEIKKEKEIIIDEINSYYDNPSELIFDEFEELIYPGNPIGRSILGKPENIRRFEKEDILRFINKNYHTTEMIFCSSGNIPFQKLIRHCEKHFANKPYNPRKEERVKLNNYFPQHVVLDKHTHQSHCVIGNCAFDLKDNRRTSMHLLNNILGGPGMNSRLNLSLREKNGYSYYIESNYNPYTDGGTVSIYFGTDRENLDKSISLAYKEFEKLKTKKLGYMQLSRAKKQLAGQLAISLENKENLVLSAGKSLLVYNKIESIESVNKKIESVTADQIMEIANLIFDNNSLSLLAYK